MGKDVEMVWTFDEEGYMRFFLTVEEELGGQYESRSQREWAVVREGRARPDVTVENVKCIDLL